jgi:DNA-binding HxlR family transcriptional regulator
VVVQMQAVWAKCMSCGWGGRNATIEVFGDRCSLLVLRDIVFADRRYFRELQAGSQEGIASNILADRLKRLIELGLLTHEDTRAGQRARYSLTEPRSNSYPCSRSSAAGDFATGPRAARCAFAPSCSNKAAPRSGRSSWTSFAASTLLQVPSVQTPTGELRLSSRRCRVGVLHFHQPIAPPIRERRRFQIDAVDAETVQFLECGELARDALDQVSKTRLSSLLSAIGRMSTSTDMVASAGSSSSRKHPRIACEPTTITSGRSMI